MIAAWMLYSVTLGLILTGAALLAERMVHDLGGATRRVWALAIVGGVTLPVGATLLPEGAAVPGVGAFGGAASPAVMASLIEGADLMTVLDGTLTTVWIGASVLLFLGVVACGAATWVRHRRWRQEVVDGVSVLVAPDAGPAVVGFLRGRIVLPAWALAASPAEREVMLRHEREHLSGGDPRLVLFGLVLLVCMPWNLPLWYMSHRLRLAVEVDCDRRVLRSGGLDVGTYGRLLLAVGGRRSVTGYAMGFSRPRSLLEHRIDRMTLPRGRASGLRAAVLGLAAVAAVAVVAGAWLVPSPVRAATSGLEFSCPAGKAPVQQVHRSPAWG